MLRPCRPGANDSPASRACARECPHGRASCPARRSGVDRFARMNSHVARAANAARLACEQFIEPRNGRETRADEGALACRTVANTPDWPESEQLGGRVDGFTHARVDLRVPLAAAEHAVVA